MVITTMTVRAEGKAATSEVGHHAGFHAAVSVAVGNCHVVAWIIETAEGVCCPIATYRFVCIPIYADICLLMYLYIYIHMHTHMCMHTYKSIYIYMYNHTYHVYICEPMHKLRIHTNKCALAMRTF